MNTKLIAIIIGIAIVGIIIFMFVGGAINPAPPIDDDWTDPDGNIIGTLSQTIRIDYADGTSVTVGEPSLLWIYNQDKIIDTFTYILSARTNSLEETPVDISGYEIELQLLSTVDGIVGTEHVQPQYSEPIPVTIETILFTHTFNPYDFIDYGIISDGYYSIMIVPGGTISVNNEITSNPSSFSFDVEVKDERYVHVDFGVN